MHVNNPNLVLGLLAHVDSGKTTLAESILYVTGGIRNVGRVDHGDAFLDTHELEKNRGITIFAKQAQVTIGEGEAARNVTLLDTPGHVDFSAETERTLGVLDAAVLLVSSADKVTGHVKTLWSLLKRHNVPTFIFVNKMDQAGADKEAILADLQEKLSEECIDFSVQNDDFYDAISMCEEGAMEEYLENGEIASKTIASLVERRRVFPCFLGSALKVEGVRELLWGITTYLLPKEYPAAFGARVYKIARDENGNRLTHIKVTGGSLRVKELISGEKADQLRVYSGAGFTLSKEVQAGGICAITGLSSTYAGQGIGSCKDNLPPVLVPVLNYRILFPDGTDLHKAMKGLSSLEEELPELSVVWDERNGEIGACVMGEVQLEILKSLIFKRLGCEVTFGEGRIVYKETITDAVIGIGHFEPLRHYAEVQLLLEPGEEGSGLVFEANCRTEILATNWQRLVLTHLEEKRHPGVLTGSEITDIKITLIAGRAHQKHTEGGDFRQATYRAVRQGLMMATNRLLEPYYEYTLEIPSANIGRAMTDIQRMCGEFTEPDIVGEMAYLTGICPVATMNNYAAEVMAYTGGKGHLSCRFKCYKPCHNEEEVLASSTYDSDGDLDNPTGSVFCAHGAGYVVPWYEVHEHAHVEYALSLEREEEEGEISPLRRAAVPPSSGERIISREEIEEIFQRTYGNKAKDKNPWNRPAAKTVTAPKEVVYKPKKVAQRDKYLLVDGYNIIFAWEELKALAEVNIDGARGKLLDILSNYQGYMGMTLIVVFDAYKVKGNPGSVQMYHNIHVVYTKEAETADAYIEKAVHRMAKDNDVTVATSDALEQMIIWGAGARRLSAQGLLDAIKRMESEITSDWL